MNDEKRKTEQLPANEAPRSEELSNQELSEEELDKVAGGAGQVTLDINVEGDCCQW